MTNQIRYEFQSVAHRNEASMLSAIAGEYLSAGGMNSDAEQAKILADTTDADVGAECISGWGPDQGTEDRASHMDFNGYTAADLAAAFKALR